MNVRLLIIVGITLSLGFTGTAIAEKGFDMKDYDGTFTVIENPMKYVIPYKTTDAIINDVHLSCDLASFEIFIKSNDSGTLQLDLPPKMIGGVFMMLVDGVEWDDGSIIRNVVTVNFPENTSEIKIFGSYYLTTEKNDGVCDVYHNPPYYYILSPLEQFQSGISPEEISCKVGLETAIKKSNGHPLCLTPDTKEKLIQREWAEPVTIVEEEWINRSK